MFQAETYSLCDVAGNLYLVMANSPANSLSKVSEMAVVRQLIHFSAVITTCLPSDMMMVNLRHFYRSDFLISALHTQYYDK